MGILTDSDLRASNSQKGSSVQSNVHFKEIAREVGIDFEYTNGAAGDGLMVESTGGGGGWLDYDVDGRPDIYLCQGNLPTAPLDINQPRDAFFRQTGAATFARMEDFARIEERRYGQGVCIGDYNDDGFDDIYVTNVGRNTLWRNMGDGTFLDVTEEAGVGDERWSSSAAFADLDLDGDLDLYCCNYCVYDVHNPIICRDVQGKRRICHPKDVQPWPDECFFNQGDGMFRAEALQRGLYGPGNKALGVVIADFDRDGDPDIYVANDTHENFYFENDGKGYFKECAQRKGCAVNRNGMRQASMGLAFGDFDRDGWQDIYSTHFYADSNTLYRNLGGKRGFEDVTGYTQLHEPTLPFLGFGAVMHDFDQDGRMELLIANGHIDSEVGERLYRMPTQLFTFRDNAWIEIGSKACDAFAEGVVGRGVAAADFDADGDWDVLLVTQNSRSLLFRNDSERGRWLKCEFRGSESNRRGIGCRVEIKSASGERIADELCGGSSFASSRQHCLLLGLGEATTPLALTVTWPSGRVQVIDGLEADRVVVLREMEAAARAPSVSVGN